MKKVFYSLLSLFIVGTGCEKNTLKKTESFSIFPVTDIFFTSNGQTLPSNNYSAKIKVNTNLPHSQWGISTDQKWCRISDTKYLGYFDIDVWSNYETDARTATITVTTSITEPIFIKVHQAAPPSLNIIPSTPQYISEKGGTIDVSVVSEAYWKAQSDAKWAVVGTKSGTGNGSTRISVAPNPNNESGEATISFYAGSAYEKLVIYRNANPYGPYITIDPRNDQTMPATGGKFTVSIKSNGSWTVSSNKSWVTVGTKTGQGNGSTQLVVAPNTNQDNSVATISFRAQTAYKQIEIERKSAYRYVREGYSSTVVYTIDGKYIREGYSGSVVYTINGKYIQKGYSGSVVYTIDGKYIREGSSGSVVYTIDGRYIREGYSGNVVYNID